MVFLRVLMFASLLIITKISVVICFYEYVEKYEKVDFQVLQGRNKRSAFPNFHSNSSTEKIDLEIQFVSYGKKFHMLLLEDELFQQLPVEFDFPNVQKSRPRSVFYEGFLQDDANSSVICFLSDNLLTGKVTDLNYTYFMEPASIFLNNSALTSNKIVVYRNVDIPRQSVFPHYPKNFPEWKVLYRLPNISINITIENSGLDIFNQTEDLFCEIEVVADHTVYNFYQNNTDRLIAVLYYHGKFADYIFRRSDFNMDGNPDNIRIVVKKVFIYKSVETDNYPMVQASSITDYLTLFTSRQQGSKYCLSIGMFYRPFHGTAIGEAFKPEFRFSNAIGGICDLPLPRHSGFGTLSFNTGVINMQYQNGQPIPLGITMLAFTHEIGHGFGSSHDPLDHSMCSPGKVVNFLMHPFSTHGSINAMKFSKCSRGEIKDTLLLKGGCLKDRVAFCGNGIHEDKEECDCGEEHFCNLIDPCCTPSDAKPPEIPCSIRSQKEFECSPKESECCDKNCSVIKRKDLICNSDVQNCLYSFCDGESPKCPKLQIVHELCATKLTCNSTSCNNISVCASLGFEDCLCTDYPAINHQCLQCCFKNACIPASELGIVNSEGKPFTLQSGVSCNGGLYTCDDSGNCVSNGLGNNAPVELYISVIVIPLIIVMLILFLKCYFGKRRTENDTVILTDNM